MPGVVEEFVVEQMQHLVQDYASAEKLMRDTQTSGRIPEPRTQINDVRFGGGIRLRSYFGTRAGAATTV